MVSKILHITNDYSGSTVYKNLVKELDGLGVEQIVYTPIRGLSKIGANFVELAQNNSVIIYSPILNWHIDRIFYPYKIYKIYLDIQKKIDFSKVDFIHAHTWYSDGGVALLLSKKYGVPFICAIRSTDINVFHRRLFYLRPFGIKIIKSAKKLILISESYKDKFFEEKSIKKLEEILRVKTSVLPNGVDKYWLENISESIFGGADTRLDKKIELIFVGTFIKRKHLVLIQQAVIDLNFDFKYDFIHLNIVGGGGEDEANVLKLVKNNPNYFTYHGKIHDKDKLRDLYRQCDFFIMPSSSETFGLVYVEAMTQGLPILYTQGEGIDGFYNDYIGEKVIAPNIIEIKNKILKMIENKGRYIIPMDLIKKNHSWSEIAKKYFRFYKK